jgi:hypothetical protein
MLIQVDVLTVRFTEGCVARPSRCYHIYGVTGVVVAANGTAQDRVEPTAKAEAVGFLVVAHMGLATHPQRIRLLPSRVVTHR